MVWHHLISGRRVVVVCFLCGIINCCNLLVLQSSERFRSSVSNPLVPESSRVHPAIRGNRSTLGDASENILSASNGTASEETASRMLTEYYPTTTNHSIPSNLEDNITSIPPTPSPVRIVSRPESVAKLVLSHRIPFELEDRPDAVPFQYQIDTSLPHWQQMGETKKAAVARVADSRVPLPRPPVNVFPLRKVTKLDKDKPVLTILAATRSYPRQKDVATTNLQQRLIPSLVKTISVDEQRLWSIQLWIAMDDSDAWWMQHWHELQNVPDWMDVFFAVFPDELHRIPFNEVAYLAYNTSRPDYLCRVNDDSEFTSVGWITHAAETLVQLTPPNVGVVGPSCKQGNTQILTHDFVHASHMEIFDGLYYPPVFKNWYLDDYVSVVYSRKVLGEQFHRVFQPKEWSVKHWLSTKRYHSTTVDSQWLPFEYEIGHHKIRTFVEKNFPLTEPMIPPSMPAPSDSAAYNEIRKLLRSDDDLLVWGMDFQETPALHRLSSGRVLFLEDPLRPQPNQRPGQSTCSSMCLIVGNFPYIHHDLVMYTTNHTDVALIHQNIQNDILESDVQGMLCNFQIPLLQENINETNWDVFFVDGSALASNNGYIGPGPFQAVFTILYLLSQQKTGNARHLLVRGYTDVVEKLILDKLLGRSPNTTLDNLALYTFSSEDVVPDPSLGCPKALLRIAGHYKGSWNHGQVQAVIDALPPDGNLLVFGAQNDPGFWGVSARGHVRFIESDALWAPGVGKLVIDVFRAHHPSLHIQAQKVTIQNSPASLARARNDTQTVSFPQETFSGIPWNVLLLSCQERSMFQSLVDAQRIVKQTFAAGFEAEIHVFVDHFETESVMNFAMSVFSQGPRDVHERVERGKHLKLAHFTFRPGNHTTVNTALQ